MDTVLGLVVLVLYVAAVIACAMAATFLVVKISPSQSAKEQDQQS